MFTTPRRHRVGLLAVIMAAAPMLVSSASNAGSECDPDTDPDCLPRREECAAGGHNGVQLDPEQILPGAICLSVEGSEAVYVAGDPAGRCGVIAVGGVTLTDTVDGDPNRCRGPELSGYLTVEDGTRLRWSGRLPDGDGPYPVALRLTTYSEGVDSDVSADLVAGALLQSGYAVISVNLRGTGCSGGIYDVFRPHSDLYEAVEWAAAQPWSTGDVGTFGYSALAFSQLLAASTRPPSLRAIAPNEFPLDIYRDFNRPGGLLNVGFGPAWGLAWQPAAAALSYPTALRGQDAECMANQASGGTDDPTRTGKRSVEIIEQPYDGDWYRERSPQTYVSQIEVPVLTCFAWQDDQGMARIEWMDDLDPRNLWAVFTNGYHGACDVAPAHVEQTVDFFDAFVHPDRHVTFHDVPHVQILHETTGEVAPEAGWVTTHRQWPVRVEPTVWHLGPASLRHQPTQQPATAGWAYPLPAASNEANSTAGSESVAWSATPTPEGFVAFTTPPLQHDVEIFGSGSLDLWLTSTAPSTDLQVTLVEVRPDGQEMYLRRGWLRASHRALDPDLSTILRPWHTHAAGDVADLPNNPTLVRVEIPSTGHVFRAGSSIRVLVDAPTGRTGMFQFDADLTPAVNTIHMGPNHPSRLVLGVVPGGTAPVERPDCGTVLRTPCRDNPFATVPADEA